MAFLFDDYQFGCENDLLPVWEQDAQFLFSQNLEAECNFSDPNAPLGTLNYNEPEKDQVFDDPWDVDRDFDNEILNLEFPDQNLNQDQDVLMHDYAPAQNLETEIKIEPEEDLPTSHQNLSIDHKNADNEFILPSSIETKNQSFCKLDVSMSQPNPVESILPSNDSAVTHGAVNEYFVPPLNPNVKQIPPCEMIIKKENMERPCSDFVHMKFEPIGNHTVLANAPPSPIPAPVKIKKQHSKRKLEDQTIDLFSAVKAERKTHEDFSVIEFFSPRAEQKLFEDVPLLFSNVKEHKTHENFHTYPMEACRFSENPFTVPDYLTGQDTHSLPPDFSEEDDPTNGFKLPASKSPIMEAMVVCALNGWGIEILKNSCHQDEENPEVTFRVLDFDRYYKISRLICSKQRPTDDVGSRVKSLRRWFVNFPKKKDRCESGPFLLTVKPNIAKKVAEIIERNTRVLGLAKRRRRQ